MSDGDVKDDLMEVLEGAAQEVEQEAPVVEKEEEAAPAPEQEATGELETTTWEDRPPSSWKPAVREKWKDLPEEVRQEVLRREESSVLGIRKIHEQTEPYRALRERVGPYLAEIHQRGGDPVQYTNSLLEMDRQIRHAQNPQQRLSVLLTVAEAYGVPLRNLVNQAAGTEVIPEQPRPQSSIPPEVARELAEMRQWRQQQTQSVATGEVESFGADKEFFHDVRGHMADLIEAGVAKDMHEAYDKACWAIPEVRQVLLQREKGGVANASRQSRQQAAAAASPAPGRGIAAAAHGGDEEDDNDIGAILRQEFTRSSTGRL